MKKVISFILVVVLVFSLSTTAFAKTEKRSPVLFVAGLNTCDLMLDGEVVFPPAGDKITTAVKSAILPAIKSILTFGGFVGFTKAICDAADPIFEPVKMNPDTTSKYPVYIEDSSRYSTSADIYNSGQQYFFTYDWRFSPLDIADLLNDRINTILSTTGCEKITLYTHSMGGCVLTSYLEKYGHSKVDRLVITDPAFQGMDFVGDLFTGHMKLDKDVMMNFLTDLLGSTENEWILGLLEVLNVFKVTDGICKFCNDVLLKNMYDQTSIELGDFFFLLPSLWSFCPASEYEAAKEYAFGKNPDAKYSKLIEKNDYYIYNVQQKTKDLLDSCIADGIPVSIVCAYGFNGVPVGLSGANQADGVIDTKYASFGATCAPYGKMLGAGYVQAVNDGHNHISADNAIDASTCIYPEYTWFVKGIKHPDSTEGLRSFHSWLLNFDGQPDIRSNEEYPQFLESNSETEELLPVSKCEEPQPVLDHILDAFYHILNMIFSLLVK